MSNIDYTQLSGGVTLSDPPDGTHTAYVAVAKLLSLDSGDRLVTEWQVPGKYYWTTWHGFEPNRMQITQEFLDGLGVDRSQITDDASFEDALLGVQGVGYVVRTSHWSGGVNTFVEEIARAATAGGNGQATQSASQPAAAPQSAAGALTAPEQPALTLAGALVDDDIPF